MTCMYAHEMTARPDGDIGGVLEARPLPMVPDDPLLHMQMVQRILSRLPDAM